MDPNPDPDQDPPTIKQNSTKTLIRDLVISNKQKNRDPLEYRSYPDLDTNPDPQEAMATDQPDS